MRGLGTILNVVAILVGASLGVVIGHRLPERTRRTVTDALGLVTLVIGVIVLHVALFGLLLFTACLTLPPGTVLPCSGARGDLC